MRRNILLFTLLLLTGCFSLWSQAAVEIILGGSIKGATNKGANVKTRESSAPLSDEERQKKRAVLSSEAPADNDGIPRAPLDKFLIDTSIPQWIKDTTVDQVTRDKILRLLVNVYDRDDMAMLVLRNDKDLTNPDNPRLHFAILKIIMTDDSFSTTQKRLLLDYLGYVGKASAAEALKILFDHAGFFLKFSEPTSPPNEDRMVEEYKKRVIEAMGSCSKPAELMIQYLEEIKNTDIEVFADAAAKALENIRRSPNDDGAKP